MSNVTLTLILNTDSSWENIIFPKTQNPHKKPLVTQQLRFVGIFLFNFVLLLSFDSVTCSGQP